jgi:hypothetical protein
MADENEKQPLEQFRTARDVIRAFEELLRDAQSDKYIVQRLNKWVDDEKIENHSIEDLFTYLSELRRVVRDGREIANAFSVWAAREQIMGHNTEATLNLISCRLKEGREAIEAKAGSIHVSETVRIWGNKEGFGGASTLESMLNSVSTFLARSRDTLKRQADGGEELKRDLQGWRDWANACNGTSVNPLDDKAVQDVLAEKIRNNTSDSASYSARDRAVLVLKELNNWRVWAQDTTGLIQDDQAHRTTLTEKFRKHVSLTRRIHELEEAAVSLRKSFTDKQTVCELPGPAFMPISYLLTAEDAKYLNDDRSFPVPCSSGRFVGALTALPLSITNTGALRSISIQRDFGAPVIKENVEHGKKVGCWDFIDVGR